MDALDYVVRTQQNTNTAEHEHSRTQDSTEHENHNTPERAVFCCVLRSSAFCQNTAAFCCVLSPPAFCCVLGSCVLLRSAFCCVLDREFCWVLGLGLEVVLFSTASAQAGRLWGRLWDPPSLITRELTQLRLKLKLNTNVPPSPIHFPQYLNGLRT